MLCVLAGKSLVALSPIQYFNLSGSLINSSKVPMIGVLSVVVYILAKTWRLSRETCISIFASICFVLKL